MADTQQSEQDIFKPEQVILGEKYRILNRLDKNQGYYAEVYLGFPLSAEEEIKAEEQWYQHFEHGDIFFTWQNSAVVVKGTILAVYNQFDGIQGKFGFPKAPETSSPENPDLVMQEFENGVICVKMK